MNEQEEKTVERTEKKQPDLIPEERLQELLNILLPYGYSHYDKVKYTGVSPYIGRTYNVITIVANDPEGWGSIFAICMDKFSEDEDETYGLGFYKGIMKVIAPELYCDDEKFDEKTNNVLDFYWAYESQQNNAFPVEIKYKQR